MTRLCRTRRWRGGVACLAAAGVLAACDASGAGTRGGSVRTVTERVGDTVVARTTGEVPDADLRHLALVWRTGHESDDAATSFATIGSIAITPDDRVFVWDPQGPALRLYDADGTLAREVGRKGSGPGEYDRLNGITVLPDGRLVAWDGGNARLNVYDGDGTPVTTWRPAISSFFTSNALIADRQGRAWVRAFVRTDDPSFGALGRTAWFRLDTAGVPLDTVMAPEPARRDPELVARREQGGGVSTSSAGIPYGRYPRYAVSPLGGLVWGPADPYVLYVETGDVPLRIERDGALVPVSNVERAQLRASTEWNMRQTDPNWRWQGPDVPATKPAYGNLAVGLDGRVWVQIHVPSEEFEPDPPLRVEENPRPQVRFRSTEARWDVFEPDGTYLGRVAVPRHVTLMAQRGDFVWGVLRDEDQVPSLAKFRVTPGLRAP